MRLMGGVAVYVRKVSNYIAFFSGVMDRENFMAWNVIFFEPTAVLSARSRFVFNGQLLMGWNW